MLMLRLAFRNLFRNTRRTLLTLAAITFGLSLMIWTVNFQAGSYEAMISEGVASMAGHVVVQAEGYQEEKDVAMVVQDTAGVASVLQAEFPDAVIAPRINMGGLLTSPSTSAGVGLSGFDAAAELQVQDLHEKVVEGEWLGDDDREIVIGQGLATSLEVGLDDKVVFMGQAGTDEVQSRMFRVKGIFRTGAASLDGRMAFCHLGAAQELLGGGDVAHMVTVHMGDPDEAFAAADRAEELLADRSVEVLDWNEAIPQLAGMIQMDRASGDVMMVIIGLIVAFGVLNTLMMGVMERTREFGVMLSLGMKPSGIARLVLLEGLVVGVLGATLGLLAGLVFSYHAVYVGIDYAAFSGGEAMEMEGILIDSVMKGAWSPARMAYYYGAAVFFCLCAAAYPAWSISKLKPVEAMRAR